MTTPIRDKSTREIAEILDVDPSTVQNWVKAGCPCDRSKNGHKLSESEVVAWMKDNDLTGRMGCPIEGDSEELRALKIRKERALVLRYERENDIANGTLINAADENARDIQKVITLRNRLCGLGSSLAPQLIGMDGPEIQSLIDQEIELMLIEFSR